MIKRLMNKKSLSIRESAETLKKITSGKKPKIKMTADKKNPIAEAKETVNSQASLFEDHIADSDNAIVNANDESANYNEPDIVESIAPISNLISDSQDSVTEEQVENKEEEKTKKPFLKAVTSFTSVDNEDDTKGDLKEKEEDAKEENPQVLKFENLKKDSSSSKNVHSLGKKSSEKKERKKPKLISANPKKGLHICNLGKSYGDKPAVRDISMVVNQGEAVGLLGPNGAGKTTSFYMIMGLIHPDYGTISLDGTDITNLPVYRRARMGIGYLPQEASIFRGMTVEENILSVLEISEPVAEKRASELDSLLGEFSITHLRRSPAIALSGGERRRVEIARALASNPSFILLDEPLAGIDPVAVADIKELISHLKNRGIGVLITDHNVREALDLINRAYIIHDGKVLMEGTPTEIVGNKEVRRVYLGDKFSL
jgi:lipopolysaccharide export system ATP-binding protein